MALAVMALLVMALLVKAMLAKMMKLLAVELEEGGGRGNGGFLDASASTSVLPHLALSEKKFCIVPFDCLIVCREQLVGPGNINFNWAQLELPLLLSSGVPRARYSMPCPPYLFLTRYVGYWHRNWIFVFNGDSFCPSSCNRW